MTAVLTEPAVTRTAAAVPVDEPRSRRAIIAPVIALGCMVLLGGLSVTASRGGAYGLGIALFFVAVMIPFGVGAAVLLSRPLSGRPRTWLVVLVGVAPTLLYRLADPLLLTGFDEQLHLRTLSDLAGGAPLYSPNPLLEASPHFPGLELLTVALQRGLGLPTMVAVTAVVVLCRVVLVLAVYRLATTLIGDQRAAAIAVLCYAVSPQFYFFNSQYAYQTLALSLAVAGLMLLTKAVRSGSAHRTSAVAAVVCFAGVAVTHHLTSWITALALVVWAALAGPAGRRTIGAVATATLALVVAQAIPIAPLLSGYFGPMVDAAVEQGNVMLGGGGRALFADSAGVSTPTWERVLLIGYAVICTVAAVLTGWTMLRHAYRRRHRLLLVLGALCLAYPATFAGRLAPEVSDICERATTFVFLPVALGIAWVCSGRGRTPRVPGLTRLARHPVPAAVLIGVAFLGGLILGSGPDWGRLPGSYLVVADSRSLDAETLAAAAWSRDHLDPGSSVMADRMPATLLASMARLWPDVQPRDGIEPATLYFSETWGPEQTDTVRAMRLRYLYVDSRLAESLPHQRSYFYPGETPDQRRLTATALAKFGTVPGIVAVYRHGPIAVYDLAGLQDTAPPVHGWTGDRQPHPWRDAGAGLLAGLLLAWWLPAMRRRVRTTVTTLGGVGSVATAMAGLVLLTGLATAAGFRPGWSFTLALAVPLAIAVPARGDRHAWVRTWSAPDPEVAAAATLALILAAVGATLAVRSAWLVDVAQVTAILAGVPGAGG